MHEVTDITGRGCYVLAVGETPFVIKVDVLRGLRGRFVAYYDPGASIPGWLIPQLCELLTAVQGRVNELNEEVVHRAFFAPANCAGSD